MASYLVRALSLLVLLIPALVWAGSLDEYYLARFAPKARSVQLFTGVAGLEAAEADRCLTPLYRSLKRDWKQLEPATRIVLAKRVARPVLSAAAAYPSPGGHFVIHYATSGADAPDLSDADGNGVPDWVEQVAAVFENVYSAEVTTMGYRPPPVVRYDVYLEDLTSLGAYGFTTDDGFPAAPSASSASYIEIDKAFTAAMFEHTATGDFTPLQSLSVTAAHEFNHAIQYGYNYYFDIWYAEATATWMEDEVYDAVNQLYSYLPGYLGSTATLSLDAPINGRSEYGRWIFNRYLAQDHSNALIRDIWKRLSTLAAPADGSDIPMLPVIEATLGSAGSTLSGEFFGFAENVYLRNWTTHPGDLSRIPAVTPAAIFTSYPVVSSAAAGSVVTLPHYSFAYYQFLPSATAPADLTLTFSALPSGMDVIAFRKGSDGSITTYPLNQSAGTLTVPSFNTGQTAEVQLLVSNSGSSDGASVSFGSGGTAAVVAAGAGASKGGCFIATAAYGSYLHPKVALLRAFRDRYLLTNPPGRLFVALYYRVSPPIAELIARHAVLRGATRLLLAPVVLAVEHGRLALLLLGLGCLVPVIRRFRECRTGKDEGLDGGRPPSPPQPSP